MEKAEIQSLIRDAFEAQKFAYVPYSRFHVGAALLGHKKGDKVETTGPTGRDISMTIIKIEH